MDEHLWRWLGVSALVLVATVVSFFGVRDLVDSVGPRWAARLFRRIGSDRWDD